MSEQEVIGVPKIGRDCCRARMRRWLRHAGVLLCCYAQMQNFAVTSITQHVFLMKEHNINPDIDVLLGMLGVYADVDSNTRKSRD